MDFENLRAIITETYKEVLNERLITFNNGKKNGQIVFLAGGAGSGKGFAISNFMDASSFKVRDVDEWKKLFLKLDKKTKKYPEIRGLDLQNSDDVFKLHMFVQDLKIKDKTLDLLLSGAKVGKLPNIMFDITLKDAGDLTNVLPRLLQLGYNPRDIHIVWVLTEFDIAVKNNAKRERVVPEDILLQTHEGAANTMHRFIKNGLPTGVDGGAYVILNNPEHTIWFENSIFQKNIDPDDPDKGITVRDFMYLTLKRPGKGMVKNSDIQNQLYNWISSNIPNVSMNTADVRRDASNIIKPYLEVPDTPAAKKKVAARALKMSPGLAKKELGMTHKCAREVLKIADLDSKAIAIAKAFKPLRDEYNKLTPIYQKAVAAAISADAYNTAGSEQLKKAELKITRKLESVIGKIHKLQAKFRGLVKDNDEWFKTSKRVTGSYHILNTEYAL